jgi:hypothetical protein
VVQLKITNPDSEDALCLARRFPFTIGRASGCDLALAAPGLWDRHVELRLKKSDGFLLAALGDALVTVNDQPVRAALLRNGDMIGLGALRIQFALSPTTARTQRWRERLVWLGLAAVLLGQVALIYYLPA